MEGDGDGGATTIGVIVHMCMHELQLQVAHGCDCMLVRVCDRLRVVYGCSCACSCGCGCGCGYV